jgi:nucleotide-binding universal stress UspA family protein
VFDRLLFPTDGSDGATEALEDALDLAAAHEATLHLLTVADTTADGLRGGQDDADAVEAAGERLLRAAADRARERDVETVTALVRGEPYREIVDYAASRDVDLVVMPTHGRRGLERLLLGSTTERVLRRADVPVLTLRPDTGVGHPYRTVLVPTDGSDCATEALGVGCEVATAEGADLHLLSVVSLTSLGVDVRTDIQTRMLEEAAEDTVERASSLAAEAGVEPAAGAVEYGSSVHGAILAYVEEHDVDLVVVGTHGRTGFDRYLLGSVTEALVRTAPVPVLTVRGPTPE